MPGDDICIIALSNSSSDRVGEMVRVLMSVLYNQPYKLTVERKSIALSLKQMQQYTGI